MHAAAVIGRNYVPLARVLADSLHAHHQGLRFTLVVVDGPAHVDGAEVLTPADIGVDAAEFERRGAQRGLRGLLGSMRPTLLGQLLDGGADAVLLMDVDMLCLGPLDDVFALAVGTGVVLSPHALRPLPGVPGRWPEEALLRAGTFNAGLVGVGRQGRDFLTWVEERTRFDCVHDPERGLYFWQTWLNLVPALWPHHVLRDEGVNAMVVRLGERDLQWRGDVPHIDETPVRLFHFGGFDREDPWPISGRHPDPAFDLGARPGLARLARRYGQLALAAGWPALD